MEMKTEQTIVLDEKDIKIAIAFWLVHGRLKINAVEATNIQIKIDPGSPYGGQFDPGRDSSVQIIVKNPLNQN